MHVNNQYVRKGDLNVNALFILEDCTDIVQERIYGIKGHLKTLIKVVNSDIEPVIDIGPDGHFKFPHLWPGQNPPPEVKILPLNDRAK